MTVLSINGRRVRVDDRFKSLTPEQQNATVEEISKSLTPSTPAPSEAGPQDMPSTGTEQPEQPSDSGPKFGDHLQGAGVTWLENSISGIPVVGPGIQAASDFLGSNVQGLVTGEDPAQIRAGLNARRAERNETYPATAISGQLGGNIAAMGGVGATAAGAEALGITGAKLLPRVLNSAGSSALISSADTATRGGDAEEVVTSGLVGGGFGGAIPVVGAGIRAGINAIGERVAPIVNTFLKSDDEAARRVSEAFKRDRLAGDVVNSTDEAVAQSTGVPLLNVDRAGETARALARSAANQAPEARQIISKVADDRFATQGNRAVEAVRRIAGGSVDDIGYQEAIRTSARRANKPAYEAAYGSTEAQQVFTPRIQELMQSPSFRAAVDTAPRRSADRAAVEGFKEVANPFARNSQGAYVLRRNADGTVVSPNLQFWDQVQRNLRSEADKAFAGGDKTRGSELKALRAALVDELDAAVPAFKSARQGASAFFGAEDAVEAGKKFAGTPRLVPEARKAFEKFSQAEKAGFQTGYASELIDRIKSAGDRTNIINSVFKSQSSRESLELVFGPQKLRELEAYVRVEDIADRLRGAMGNSTTARQLMELGIGGVGAGGGYAVTGDWKGAIAGGLAARGGRALQGKAETQVMQAVAKMLTSSDPRVIANGVSQAEKSPAFMKALDQIGNVLAAPSRAVPRVLGQEQRQPLEITVTPRRQ